MNSLKFSVLAVATVSLVGLASPTGDLCVYRCSTGAKVPELQGQAGDHRWHGRRRPWNVAQGRDRADGCQHCVCRWRK